MGLQRVGHVSVTEHFSYLLYVPFSILSLLSFELIILLIIQFLFYISLYVIYATILYDYIRNSDMHM